MDQVKIGAFIAKMRKNKNMTQIELANKLNITDRAVSNYENGRRMPDISLLLPLCDILGITLDELLSGEKIKKEEYHDKSNKVIFNIIEDANKKRKKLIKVVIFSIFLFISMIIALDFYQMSNNKPVIFSTWGFNYYPPLNLDDIKIKQTIKDYIKNEKEFYKESIDEENFVAIKVYETKKKNNIYIISAWILEKSYYLENGVPKERSGSSIPHKFELIKEGDFFKVLNYTTPRDGGYYFKDMKKLFSYKVRKNMDKIYFDGTSQKLDLEISDDVKLYFHL